MNEVEKLKVIDKFMQGYLPLKDDIITLLKTMPDGELTKERIIAKLNPIATPLFEMYEKPLNDIVSVYTDDTVPFLIMILEKIISELKRVTDYSPEMLDFLEKNAEITTCVWSMPFVSAISADKTEEQGDNQ